MKIISMKTIATILLLMGAVAFARQPEPDVAQTVSERAGKELRLPASGGNDEARDIVRRLLRRTLTAESAAQAALLNNRSFQATLEDIGISQADLREAGFLKNPEFTGSARFPDRPPLAADLEGALVQDFLDVLMLPLRKRVAAAQLEQTKLRVANEALGLVSDTKVTFYELQAQMQLLGMEKLILETQQAATELAQKQHEAGNIPDLALVTQQAAYSQARLEVAMIGAEIREKREKLNRLMGVWGVDTGWKISSELPPVPDAEFSLKGLESLAVGQRVDLEAAHAQLASVVQALGLVKTYRFTGALELGVDSERNPDRSTVTGPTLRIELPVFNQGQARVAKAEAQLRQAERRFEALAIDIRSEVREKRDQLIAKRDAAKFYHDELVPGRIRIVNLTQLQYNAMLTGAYDLLLAKQNELTTERGYIGAVRDYWITRTGLERAVGGSLGPKRNPTTGKETKHATKQTH